MRDPLALARALVGALPAAQLSEGDLAELITALEAARRIATRRLGDARKARKVVR